MSIRDSIVVRVRRWTIAALCSATLMVATASAADAVWTSAADLNRCTALAGPPHSEGRGAYCSGLFPASRRGRCTEEVGASAADWNGWCAAEWTIRQLPEAARSSLLPADPSIQKCERPSSPIVIDVRGDGFALTDAANGVPFDLRGTGRPEVWSWTALDSDDAWLALDRNRNGLIDDGSELFGDYTTQPPSSQPNGFTALAVFDEPAEGGNRDSRIDASDGVFARSAGWRTTSSSSGSVRPRRLSVAPGPRP